MLRLWATVACAVTLGAASPDYSRIYAFQGQPDGAYPGGPLAIDRAGNLYGVTEQGGAADNGAIYEISPPRAGQSRWTEHVLASIPVQNGYDHTAGVAFSGAHSLVASSVAGGAKSCGVILTASLWGAPSLQVLHQFSGQKGDGCYPNSVPLPGHDGTLFGVTGAGGTYGLGTVYTLTPTPSDAKLSVIWDFSGPDGAQPGGPPLVAPDGTLYGTAYAGGSAGFGTVWALVPPTAPQTHWSRIVLWQFEGAPGCAAPVPGTLARDARGNLFGACQAGGALGYGGFFEISPPAPHQGHWTGRVIADADADTGIVMSGLTFARAGRREIWHDAWREGRLVTTSRGITDGSSRVIAVTPPPAGATATIETLWRFPAGIAISPVVTGPHGPLFGTTATEDAAGTGTVWSLRPQ